MLKPIQSGCKKCGAVVTIEMKPMSDRVEVRVKDGRVQERSGNIEIQCKKCLKPVALVSLDLT